MNVKPRRQRDVWPILGIADLEREGVVQLGRGKVISKNDLASTPGTYPVYSSAKENDGKFGEYGLFMFDEELISWSVDGGGRLFHRPWHKFSITNVGGFIRILRPDRVFCRYLYFVLSYLHSQVVFDWVRKAHPSVIRNIYTAIPLPPLEEQKRIVAVLDQAFASFDRARANAEANLADAAALKSCSVEFELSGAVLGKPESIGPHVELLTGFAFKSGGYSEALNDIRLVRGDNIVQGAFRWEGVKRWPIEDRPVYAKYELALDDVLIAMDRTWVSAGVKHAIVGEDALPSLLVQRVARLRAKSSIVPRYLGYWIGSKIFERYILSIQTGLGVPHVSGKQIENFTMRVPAVEDQRVIVDRLDAIVERCSSLISTYKRQLADLAAFRQSLLRKAFAGELT